MSFRTGDEAPRWGASNSRAFGAGGISAAVIGGDVQGALPYPHGAGQLGGHSHGAGPAGPPWPGSRSGSSRGASQAEQQAGAAISCAGPLAMKHSAAAQGHAALGTASSAASEEASDCRMMTWARRALIRCPVKDSCAAAEARKRMGYLIKCIAIAA